MKIKRGLGIVLGVLILSWSPAQAVIIDRIIAIVNGEIITLSGLQEINYALLSKEDAGAPSAGKEAKERESKLLDQLIDKKLQLQQAERRKIVVHEDQVLAALTEIAQNNGLQGMDELKTALTEQGLTLEGLRKQVIEKIKLNKLLKTEVRSKIVVTKEEVMEYYQQHREEYSNREWVRLRHILFQVPEDSSAKVSQAAGKRAEEAEEALRNGDSFEELMDKFKKSPGSTSGDLGDFTRGQLIPEFEEVVWKMKAGEVRQIRSRFGYQLMQVVERRLPTPDTDMKLNREIEELLRKRKLETQLKNWTEELRRQASIKVMF